jgi:hypothetical protein
MLVCVVLSLALCRDCCFLMAIGFFSLASKACTLLLFGKKSQIKPWAVRFAIGLLLGACNAAAVDRLLWLWADFGKFAHLDALDAYIGSLTNLLPAALVEVFLISVVPFVVWCVLVASDLLILALLRRCSFRLVSALCLINLPLTLWVVTILVWVPMHGHRVSTYD